MRSEMSATRDTKAVISEITLRADRRVTRGVGPPRSIAAALTWGIAIIGFATYAIIEGCT